MAKLPKIKDFFIDTVTPVAKTLIKKCNDGSITRDGLYQGLKKLSQSNFRTLSDYTMAILSISLLRWSCITKGGSNDLIRKLALRCLSNNNQKFLTSLKEGNGSEISNFRDNDSYKDFYDIVYLICCDETIESPDLKDKVFVNPRHIATSYFNRLKRITKWRLHKKAVSAACDDAMPITTNMRPRAMTDPTPLSSSAPARKTGFLSHVRRSLSFKRGRSKSLPPTPVTAPLTSSAPAEKTGFLNRARRSISFKRGRSKSLPPTPVTAPLTDLHAGQTQTISTSNRPPLPPPQSAKPSYSNTPSIGTSNLPTINPALISPYNKYNIYRYQPLGTPTPTDNRSVGFLDVSRARIYVVDFQSANTGGDRFRTTLYEALGSLGNRRYWAHITASDISEWRLLPTSVNTAKLSTTKITEAPNGVSPSQKDYIYVYSNLDAFKEAYPKPVSDTSNAGKSSVSTPSTSPVTSTPTSEPKN